MSRVFFYHIDNKPSALLVEFISLITMEAIMIVWAAWKNTVSKDALRITPKPRFKPVKLRKKTGEIKPLCRLEVQP